jgi:hypothetical protein
MWINSNKILSPDLLGIVPSAQSQFLLDNYNNSYGAYSLRKLRSGYTGNCIRVRRSSDNTEQDFGFVNNVLDTASILSFVGTGTGFVTTWYNQTTTIGLNLTQSTGVNQPRIVQVGNLYTVNGKPSLYFVDDYLQTSTNSVYKLFHDGNNSTTFIVNQTQSPSLTYGSYFGNVNSSGSAIGASFSFGNSGSVTNQLYNAAYNGSGLTVPVINFQNNAININIQTLISLFMKANNTPVADRSEIQINNGSLIKNNTNNATVSTANSGQNFAIGRSGGGSNFFNGYIQEFVCFSDDKRTTRSNINNSINSFYGTY